jgi:hypothetical protein
MASDSTRLLALASQRSLNWPLYASNKTTIIVKAQGFDSEKRSGFSNIRYPHIKIWRECKRNVDIERGWNKLRDNIG